MAAKKDFLSLVNTGGEIGRSPLVGMHFLHERAVRVGDGIGARASLQAKDLIGLVLRHFAGGSSRRPRCRVTLRVFTQPESRRSRYAASSARLSSSISASIATSVIDIEVLEFGALVRAGN